MVRRLACLLLLALALPALASDLLLEAELDAAQSPVQAQVVYRLRFLHAVDVRGVQMVGPSLRLANLHAIGEDRVYEAHRAGKRYRVHERRYAVFPFASGTLEFSGAHVTGRVPASSPSGERPLRLDFPPRALAVLPAHPQMEGAPWLPARSLQLSEQWTALEEGAQRRTIRIEAAGVEAAQLPELRMDVPGMEVVPGTRHLETRFAGERSIASSEQSFVLVPARGGVFEVPALPLRWWNVDTGAPALALLPGRRLSVDLPPPQPLPQQPAVTPAPAAAFALGPVTVAAGVVSCLLLLCVYWRRARLRRAWQLRRACMTGDALGVRDGLLAWWAGDAQDAPLTLAALAGCMRDQAAREALQAFERSLYGPAGQSWAPRVLAALVTAVKRDARGRIRA